MEEERVKEHDEESDRLRSCCGLLLAHRRRYRDQQRRSVNLSGPGSYGRAEARSTKSGPWDGGEVKLTVPGQSPAIADSGGSIGPDKLKVQDLGHGAGKQEPTVGG